MHGIPPTSLIPPHGGKVVEAVLPPDAAAALRARAPDMPAIQLDRREALDLQLVASGGASPLRGFMGHADYRSVLDRRRLASGVLFPVPLVLPVEIERLGEFPPGKEVMLHGPAGDLMGAMTVRDAFVRDLREEARVVHGTDDPAHPGAAAVLERPPGAVGGEVALLRPTSSAFETARELRMRLASHGFFRVAAALGPALHVAIRAAQDHADALLTPSNAGPALLHSSMPVVAARLPLSDRHAGTRELLFTAITLKNYGASHLVLAADGLDLRTGEALLRHRADLGAGLLLPRTG